MTTAALGASILVVEDDTDIGEAISEILQEEGYEVTRASSGKKALSVLAAGLRPAVMIVDFWMPEMNGSDFVQACRANLELVGIPTIIMSAFKPQDPAVAGLSSYLQKPFHPRELIEEVARLLSRR